MLTGLKVDPAALVKSEKSGRVKGLIITMKGNQSPRKIYSPKEKSDIVEPNRTIVDDANVLFCQALQIASRDTTSTPDTLPHGTAFLKTQSLVRLLLIPLTKCSL